DRMFVGEIVEHLFLEFLFGPAIRLVVHAQPALFLNGFTLDVEAFLRYVERANAVGFEAEDHVELVRRHGGGRGRAVLAGRRVVRASVGVDPQRVFVPADVLGACEHQVLEEVSEARAAFALVARTDVEGDGDGDDRRAVVFDEQRAQAVLQFQVFKIDVDRIGGREADRRFAVFRIGGGVPPPALRRDAPTGGRRAWS